MVMQILIIDKRKSILKVSIHKHQNRGEEKRVIVICRPGVTAFALHNTLIDGFRDCFS